MPVKTAYWKKDNSASDTGRRVVVYAGATILAYVGEVERGHIIST